MNFNMIICVIAFTLIVLYTLSYLFYRYIYTRYKIMTKDESFEELLTILKLIINTKLDIYDKNVFNKKQALDNSSYENYYKTVSAEIFDMISPELIYKLRFYITEDSIYQLIASTVNVYISERI